MSNLRFEWLTPHHEPELVALFEREGSPCYCRYWHEPDDNKAWQLRCATTPERNREDLARDVESNAPGASGLVALDEAGQVVAWMKLAPRAALPKIKNLRTYRAHDLGPDEGVWSMGCFLVDGRHRGRGLTRELVRAAVAMVRARGGRALEAYPREGLHAAEAWTGPPTAFEGFVQVAGERPYPVLRRVLDSEP